MVDASCVDDAYEASIDYLYGLINFEVKRHDRYMASKLDADRPERLMNALGSPHRRFPSIHIAGTKGKGSVAAMCAASFRAAGMKVGLYTSPHLRDFRERIRVLTPVDPEGCIPKASFTALMEEVKQVIDSVPDTTWFEVVTAIAFRHFMQQEVDIAVVEVGLGGRLDATNVLTPLVSVITSLSYDHTDFLGDTLSEIATEKGGIIKPGIPVVIASQPAEAMDRLKSIAAERGSPITVVGSDWRYEGRRQEPPNGKQVLLIRSSTDADFIPSNERFHLALSGPHQLENATVAVAAMSIARKHFPNLTIRSIAEGLENVRWSGRLQFVLHQRETPDILVDCAHNVDSAVKLRRALTEEYEYNRLWLVMGVTKGKDVEGMIAELLPLATATVFTIADHPRATDPAELVQLALNLGHESLASENVHEGLLKAWEMAAPGDLIVVTGSIFVVGDLLNEWESLKSNLLCDPTMM